MPIVATPTITIKNVFKYCHMNPGRQNDPQLRTMVLSVNFEYLVALHQILNPVFLCKLSTTHLVKGKLNGFECTL